MNKKLIYSLVSLSVLLAGCNNVSNNSNSHSANNSSTNSNTTTPSNSDTNTDVEVNNYVEIDDVSELFETYETENDYNYIVNYKCDVVSNREYQGGWEAEYMFDGINILYKYEYGNTIYTDYFIYDEATQQMIYYLDNGNGNYKYLDENNEYYFNYVSYIDYFELAGISWEDDMIFDLENKKCIPANNLAKSTIGKAIFGDNANEYWHKVEISWNDGYITAIDAISIYQEVTYYYTITLSEHGYTEGSVVVPDNVEEYTNPYQPYLKGKEEYTGVALTDAQISALSVFKNESELNYTADITWTAVYDGTLTTSSMDYKLLAEDGNYEYSYVDPSSSILTHYFYLISGSASSYPICFIDEDFDGSFQTIAYGMDDYEDYVSLIYLDRVLLYGLDPNDFIYDETKGYITAKNEETENIYCGRLFYYSESYGGLRIYLKENDDGSLVIDKIVTSLYIADDTGSAYSFLKTYSFSNINNTTINYPEGVIV